VLKVQQSAISRRIRDLEDELGVSLFIRDHGGVRLTNAGKSFVGRARRAMTHISHAAADASVRGRGEVGVIRIGIFSSLAYGFLADLLRAYTERNSSVRVDLVEGASSFLLSAIQRLEIDLAFLTRLPIAERCESTRLWTERIFVVLPTKHYLAARRKLSWQDLRGHQFVVAEGAHDPGIHDLLMKHLADVGHQPGVERHTVGRENLMNLVAIGQGLTLTNEATTAVQFPGVTYRLLDEGQVFPFHAIWSAQNDNPAFRRLLSLARLMSQQRQVANAGRPRG
jgi:DNA-binding transcriptional LysR family regulator